MPQPDGTNAEAFDGTLVAACLDVLADPESVVHQIEHAGDDIAREGLRAKADCDTNDARTGNQRTDLNPQCRQRTEYCDRSATRCAGAPAAALRQCSADQHRRPRRACGRSPSSSPAIK